MIEQIENIEKLAEAFKGIDFYDFHDAEIVSIKFDRNESVTIEVILQISHRISEFERIGESFNRFRNFDSTFKFSKISQLIMKGFGHQNVIQNLEIKRKKEKFIVNFKEIFGCDLKFECEKMEFTTVKIFET